jgi:hypothetical protein
MNQFKKAALRVCVLFCQSENLGGCPLIMVGTSATQVIAGCLSEEEIRGLKEMFKSMDSDNSGTITVDELRRGLAKKGTKLSEAEVHQLMDAVSY